MKKSLRKAAAAGTIFCLTAAAAGCMASADEKAVVDIFSFAVEYTDAENEIAQAYMESHPDVEIHVEIGTNEILRTKMSSGDQPEIFGIDGAQDIRDWAEYLEDLSDQPWVEHVYDGLLDSFMLDGKVYGIPAALQGYGLIYNKRIFEAAGIDVSALTTYDAIDKAFADLQAKIDAGEMEEQFPLLEAVMETAAAEGWIYGKHTSNMAFALEFGDAQKVLDADQIDFTYSDALKDLTDLEIRYTSNAQTPQNLNAVDYSQQMGGGFAIERVAVIQQGTWAYTELYNINPEVADSCGFLPLPMRGVTEDCIAAGTVGMVVNAKSSDRDRQAAKDYLNWRLQSEEGQALCFQYGYNLPFDNAVNENMNCLDQSLQDYLEKGKTVNWVFSSYPTGFSDTMSALFQGYLSGNETWETVVEKAKTDWSEKRAG